MIISEKQINYLVNDKLAKPTLKLSGYRCWVQFSATSLELKNRDQKGKKLMKKKTYGNKMCSLSVKTNAHNRIKQTTQQHSECKNLAHIIRKSWPKDKAAL